MNPSPPPPSPPPPPPCEEECYVKKNVNNRTRLLFVHGNHIILGASPTHRTLFYFESPTSIYWLWCGVVNAHTFVNVVKSSIFWTMWSVLCYLSLSARTWVWHFSFVGLCFRQWFYRKVGVREGRFTGWNQFLASGFTGKLSSSSRS